MPTTKTIGKLAVVLGLFANSAIHSAVLLAQSNELTRTSFRAPPPFAKGYIENVDLAKDIITIKVGERIELYVFTGRTYFFRDKQKISADRLNPGDLVRMNFALDQNGRAVIRRLKAYPPLAATP